jgi:hypothetical protein
VLYLDEVEVFTTENGDAPEKAVENVRQRWEVFQGVLVFRLDRLDRYREEQDKMIVEMTEGLAANKLNEMENKKWWDEWGMVRWLFRGQFQLQSQPGAQSMFVNSSNHCRKYRDKEEIRRFRNWKY